MGGWNAALSSYYGIYTTEDLERRWITWLRDGRGTGSDFQLYASRGDAPSQARTPQPTSTSVLSPVGDARVVRGPTILGSQANRSPSLDRSRPVKARRAGHRLIPRSPPLGRHPVRSTPGSLYREASEVMARRLSVPHRRSKMTRRNRPHHPPSPASGSCRWPLAERFAEVILNDLHWIA